MQKFILERREGMPARGNCVKFKVSWKKKLKAEEALMEWGKSWRKFENYDDGRRTQYTYTIRRMHM